MSANLERDDWLDRFLQNNFWLWPALLVLVVLAFGFGLGFGTAWVVLS